MGLFPLRKCDIVSTTYTTYPSYILSMSVASGLGYSGLFFIASSSLGGTREYFDVNGTAITGSYNVSGAVKFISSVNMSASERVSLERLRHLYASSSFIKQNNFGSGSWSSAYMVNIPHIVFGTEIKRGSLSIEGKFGSDIYTAFDDGYGGIYSGSNQIAAVFYNHGIIYIKSVWDGDTCSMFTASFSGTNKIPMNMYICKAPRATLNFSSNPSYTTYLSSSNRQEISTKNPKTFITGVGLYDKNYKLIGIAKLSQPVLNEEDTGITFKLKLHF